MLAVRAMRPALLGSTWAFRIGTRETLYVPGAR